MISSWVSVLNVLISVCSRKIPNLFVYITNNRKLAIGTATLPYRGEERRKILWLFLSSDILLAIRNHFAYQTTLYLGLMWHSLKKPVNTPLDSMWKKASHTASSILPPVNWHFFLSRLHVNANVREHWIFCFEQRLETKCAWNTQFTRLFGRAGERNVSHFSTRTRNFNGPHRVCGCLVRRASFIMWYGQQMISWCHVWLRDRVKIELSSAQSRLCSIHSDGFFCCLLAFRDPTSHEWKSLNGSEKTRQTDDAWYAVDEAKTPWQKWTGEPVLSVHLLCSINIY